MSSLTSKILGQRNLDVDINKTTPLMEPVRIAYA